MKISLFLALLIVACDPCEHHIIDRGSLSEELLNMIPYEHGEYISFQHSNGHVISFFVNRVTKQERFCIDHLCCEELVFEVNTATLSPDYPIFSFKLQINNADTSHYPISVSIGKYGCMIPDKSDSSDIDIADSVLINGDLYLDVYKLKYQESYWNKDDILRVDSLLYNREIGILKVVMANGEYYLRNE